MPLVADVLSLSHPRTPPLMDGLFQRIEDNPDQDPVDSQARLRFQ